MAWDKLEEALVYEIGKFAILWCNLEKTQFGSDCTFSKIKRHATELQIDSVCMESLAKEMNARKEYLGMESYEYVEKGFFPKGSKKNNADEINEYINCFLDNQDTEKTKIGCLLSIYRIRNNLFHGLKELNSLNEQAGLFSAVNAVLESITPSS